MSPLRTMLRLDEKVAAETRRLAVLGDRTPRIAMVAAVAGAALLHATLLALPLPSRFNPAPATIPRPELPFVWRWGPSAPFEERTEAPKPIGAAGTAKPSSPETAVAESYEPVKEPGPIVPATMIPAEMEALIPAPDLPVPASEEAPSGKVEDPAPNPTDISPLRRVTPAYPVAARSMRASGSVELSLLVREDGSVAQAQVASCTRPGVGFEASALAAARRFRYAPAAEGSGPRAVRVHVAFRAPEVVR